MKPDVKAIGYVRRSKSEPKSASLAAQRERVEAECKARGWKLTSVETDDGYSGGDLKRPALKRALAELKEGRADVLVTAKLDRLSRSVLHFTDLADRAKKEGWGIVALDLGLDSTTAAGQLAANVMASFAQYERELISERIKAALAEKRKQGVQLGRPTTTTAAIRKRIRTARARGLSYRKIADLLNADDVPPGQGGAKWYASTVRAAEKAGGE